MGAVLLRDVTEPCCHGAVSSPDLDEAPPTTLAPDLGLPLQSCERLVSVTCVPVWADTAAEWTQTELSEARLSAWPVYGDHLLPHLLSVPECPA